MTWNNVPPHVREVVAETLTDKQLEAFQLELAGWGIARSARWLGIRRTALRDRLDGAHRRLLAAGVRQDEYGRWHIERKDAA